ncbi:MAG: DUF1275 domain-containing protein [Verrucomicrobiaceae bacterium]|nr:DUF1275 domain-containing protein [Verrucomicrobiaceae bacterium]
MISLLPRWVWSFAWALAFAGGMVNVVGVLGFEHQTVTHLTGTTSMLAAALADLDGTAVVHFAAMIGSFVLGTVLSGLIIKDSALKLGRRYGVALILESLMLAAAVPLLDRGNMLGLYSAACACGLQNAMASTYSGTVVRTTHLSGMFTDLGVFLGHWLRGLSIDRRRLRLSVLIITGFLCGGIAGALLYRRFGNAALFVPAAFTALAAVAYEAYRIRHPDAGAA